MQFFTFSCIVCASYIRLLLFVESQTKEAMLCCICIKKKDNLHFKQTKSNLSTLHACFEASSFCCVACFACTFGNVFDYKRSCQFRCIACSIDSQLIIMGAVDTTLTILMILTDFTSFFALHACSIGQFVNNIRILVLLHYMLKAFFTLYECIIDRQFC